MAEAAVPEGWRRFDSGYNLFTCAIPSTWRHIKPPITEGALLCITNDVDALIEGIGFEGGPPGGAHPVDLIGHGLAKIVPASPEYDNGRVVSHDHSALNTDVRYARVVVAYEEQGRDLTVDYALVGNKNVCVQIALKTPTNRFPAHSADFATILSTLRTSWLPHGLE